MADLSTELRSYLAGISAIGSLVGTSSDARIFDHMGRQKSGDLRGQVPFIVLDESGGRRVESLDSTVGLAQATYRIYCYDDNKTGAADLWELVRINLDRAIGTWGTVRVLEVTQTSWRDRGVVYPQDNSEVWLYWTMSTFNIWHKVAQVA